MLREFVRLKREGVWHLPSNDAQSVRCHRQRYREPHWKPEKFVEIRSSNKIPFPMCTMCEQMLLKPFREYIKAF